MKRSLLAMTVLAALSGAAQAEAPTGGGGTGADASAGQSAWFARSDAAKESQPHWMTPVAVVTPRLEQEFRYDVLSQSKSGGVNVNNYGLNKGLELIPTANTEIIIGVPGYQVTDRPNGVTSHGWADETLLFKYRMLSANEENGNYIVTGFLGLSLPTGDAALTSKQRIYTPTLAVGKGWGTRESGFDIQSTLSIAVPDGNVGQLGKPIVWNTAFQGHLANYWWPELETQYTRFSGGPNDGKHQLVLTPGLVLGRYELIDRVKFVIGVGYQKPVGSFQTFNNAWQITARTPF